MASTQMAGASFGELVDAGKFTEGMYAGFGEEDDRWSDRGDRILGQKLILLDLGRALRRPWFGCFWHRDILAQASKLLGRKLRLATAYELAYFASNGWNGTDSVMALGSSWDQPSVGCHYAFIYGNGTARGLDMIWAAVLPLRNMLVLCASD